MAYALANATAFAFTNTTPTMAYLNTTEAIGGIPYLVKRLSEYLPYTVLNLCGTMIGLLGNTLIVGAVLTTKELHNPTNMLVFNLAMADLVISGFVDTFTYIGVFVGKRFFDYRPVLCQFIAAICLVACETSLMNIGFLAINRYIHICHHGIYNKVFTTKKTLIYCAITWCIGILIDVPNVAGWGGHVYDLKTLSCVWNRLASFSYSIFFPMSSIVIPCICILFCYMRIFIYASSAKNKVGTSGGSGHSDLKKSLRIAKGLFASFMLFTLCWLPYGLVVMMDYADKYPPSIDAYTMAIAHFNSSLNPVLYALSNPAFQRGYKSFLRLIFFRSKALVTSKQSKSHVSFVNNSSMMKTNVPMHALKA